VELIESDPNETGTLAEPEPRYQPVEVPPTKTEHGQTWLNTLVTILVGVILVVLIVLFARWVYHKVHDNNQAAGPNTGTLNVSPQSNPAGEQSKQKPSSSKSGTSSSGGTSSGSSSSASSNSGTSASPNETLPNNGPGDVAALFAGATLAAAGLHYIISLSRANKLT
jgi:cytoskeletal protein RodZ